MIIIRDGHILADNPTPSQQEVEELIRRAKTPGLLPTPVFAECLRAFLHRIDSAEAGLLRSVGRDYQLCDHRFLLCVGGFVGRCTSQAQDVGDEVTSIVRRQVDLRGERPAASRVPPELFPLLATSIESDCAYLPEETKEFSKLSLVCSYWAALYRPIQWKIVSFRSSERFHAFYTMTQSTPPSLPSILDFIERVVLVAIGVPDKPWIHLIPMYLRRPLFSNPGRKPRFSLAIALRSQGLPNSSDSSDKRVHMTHTHGAIPRSLSYLNFQCQTLNLTGVDFHSFSSFLLVVRSFRRLEDLSCVDVRWVNKPPERLQLFKTYPYPPLQRVLVQPFSHGAVNSPRKPELWWVSALWCWARRRVVAGEQYLLEDDETMEVMKITSLFQGFWRRKVTPTVEFIIRENYYRDDYGEPTGVKSIDVCFNIDKRAYNFIFTLKPELDFTTPPGAIRSTDNYHALHLQFITIVSTTSTLTPPGLDILVDHTQIWRKLANLQLPQFEHLVVAFSQNTEGDFLQKTLENNLPRAASGGLLDPQHGKLIVAQSSQSPPGRGCRWVRLDHATFEATDRSCLWYDDDDPSSPDNIHGLTHLWKNAG